MTKDQIVAEAMVLEPADREALAEQLLLSLERFRPRTDGKGDKYIFHLAQITLVSSLLAGAP